MKLCVLTLYLIFSVMLIIDNFLLKWIAYEFSTVLTVRILNISKNSNKVVRIVYYSISSISSLIVMFIIVYYNNLTCMFSLGSEFVIKSFIAVLFLKLRIFPFHNWIIYCYEKSSWDQIFLISSIMKFIPISFFCHFTGLWHNIIVILILNRVFISFYVNIGFSIKKMLACSTSFNNFILICMFITRTKQFIVFIVTYSVIIYFITNILGKFSCSKVFIIFESKNVTYIFILWIIAYSMLPIMTRFLLKWNFILEISKFNNLQSFIYFLFLISNILIIWKYIIVLKKRIILKKAYVYRKLGPVLSISIFVYIALFIFSFIIFNFLVS